jgi:hypothetical protein
VLARRRQAQVQGQNAVTLFSTLHLVKSKSCLLLAADPPCGQQKSETNIVRKARNRAAEGEVGQGKQIQSCACRT